MVKGKGKKKKKGKKVGPAPPPYYPVTLPEPYRFGQIIGTVVTGKNQLEEKAQKAVDACNAKSLDLDLHGMHLDEMPLRLTKLINLNVLNLQHNNLFSVQRVFDAISNCEELVDLNLSYNMLNGRVPEAVKHLKRLKTINLRANMITGFAPEICECLMMEIFDTTNNKMTEVPETICEGCPSLKELRVGGNKLVSLPEGIGGLKALTHIDAAKNSIAVLPGAAIGTLQQLQFLNVAQNALTDIPEDIGVCENLSYLNISENQISIIPPSLFASMKNLEYLFAYKNKLTSLPQELGSASKLRLASFANNKIPSLPTGIGQLRNLEELYMGGNPTLKLIPGTVHGMTSIRAIFIQNCPKLKSLPFELELCKNLTFLDLTGAKKQTCVYSTELKQALPKLKIKGGKPKKPKKGKSSVGRVPMPLGSPMVDPPPATN